MGITSEILVLHPPEMAPISWCLLHTLKESIDGRLELIFGDLRLFCYRSDLHYFSSGQLRGRERLEMGVEYVHWFGAQCL